MNVVPITRTTHYIKQLLTLTTEWRNEIPLLTCLRSGKEEKGTKVLATRDGRELGIHPMSPR
jgi:hypothetical protein